MTLVLPRARRGYPRNALTPIIIHLRNRTRYIEGFRIRCRRDDPRVQALNLRGTVRYPAGVPLLAPPTCPAAQIAPTLKPYGSYQRQFLAILGGPLLRGVWDYSTRSSLHRVLTGGILKGEAVRRSTPKGERSNSADRRDPGAARGGLAWPAHVCGRCRMPRAAPGIPDVSTERFRHL